MILKMVKNIIAERIVFSILILIWAITLSMLTIKVSEHLIDLERRYKELEIRVDKIENLLD